MLFDHPTSRPRLGVRGLATACIFAASLAMISCSTPDNDNTVDAAGQDAEQLEDVRPTEDAFTPEDCGPGDVTDGRDMREPDVREPDVVSEPDMSEPSDVIDGEDVVNPPICPEAPFVWGGNIHEGSDEPAALSAIMAERGLTRARMDLWGLDPTYVSTFRAAVDELSAQNISVEAIIFNRFSAGQPGTNNCGANLENVEETAYQETLTTLNRVGDIVQIFELQNEIIFYPNIQVGGTTGQQANDFDTPCGRFQAANLRGMSRAIVDLRAATGRPYIIILGVTDRRFGFLTFMEEKGVTFDHVGYHIYPWEVHSPLDEDPWFGEGGALGQLAQFGRPIHINEFNCGETYSGRGGYANQPDYENAAGAPVTEMCLQSLAKHLRTLVEQDVADIESLQFYELLDDPSKSPPENRFGLLYDMETPKVHMALAAAFAGGALSPSEKNALTSRNLLTPEEIADWADCSASP